MSTTPAITTSELDCTMRSATAMPHHLQLTDRYNHQFPYYTPIDTPTTNDHHISNPVKPSHALDPRGQPLGLLPGA